ncbi:hypothetical protein KKC13_06445 [bacterium]|nr:hypothetical protein [bacterium]MBU1957456.1 hypothetical protein [bacterium]
MRILLKYFLWLLSFGTLVIFYFLNTNLGEQSLGFFLEDYLSKTTKNEIKVLHLAIHQYPHLSMKLKVNNGANVLLEGEVNQTSVDMNYHLVGETFRLNGFYLEDRVDVRGRLLGPFSNLRIDGQGELFEGNGRYSFIKVPNSFQDMNFTLNKAKSQNVLKFLKQKPLIEGLVDIDAQFKRFSTYEKQGRTVVHMKKALMPTVAPAALFTLSSTIDFNDIQYKYIADMHSDIGTLKIKNGKYHQTKKSAEAEYELHLNDLAYFEKFLKYKYRGALDTIGKVTYTNQLVIQGHTKKFGGDLEYLYQDKKIDLNLKAVSLESLLSQFSYPALFSSKVYGSINYDMNDKIVLINTDLKETRFKQTQMINMIYNASGIDMLAEQYDQSSFQGGYQNELLSSTLKIDNGVSHLYLTDMKLNAQNNNVNSNFEIKMQGQEIFGEIYGTLKNPQVSVDMRKLLKYQMSKQLSGWLGTESSDAIENVQKDVRDNLKKIDVEDVKEKAKSLIESFF